MPGPVDFSRTEQNKDQGVGSPLVRFSENHHPDEISKSVRGKFIVFPDRSLNLAVAGMDFLSPAEDTEFEADFLHPDFRTFFAAFQTGTGEFKTFGLKDAFVRRPLRVLSGYNSKDIPARRRDTRPIRAAN